MPRIRANASGARENVPASAFGAKFDGLTNDTDSLDAAASAAVDAGLPLLLPPGTALVTTWAPPNDLQVRGPGRDQCSIKQAPTATATNAVTVDVSGTSGVSLKGFTIDGNKSAFGSVATEHKHALKVCDVIDLVLEDLRCTNAKGDGIYFGALTSTPTSGGSVGVKATRVLCDANHRAGCSIVTLTDAVFTGCDFNNNVGTSPQVGLNIEPNFDDEPLKNVKFVGCHANGNAGRGWQFIARIGVSGQRGVRMVACAANDNGDDGIRVYHAYDLELVACAATRNGQKGINFQTNGGSNIRIIGGDYSHNGHDGLLAWANSGAVLAHVKVIGGDFNDNGQAGGSYAGIRFGAGTGTVEGAHISGVTAANVEGATQTHGIRTGAGVSRVTLIGNDVHDNATADALLEDDAATRVAVGNRGIGGG